MAQLTQEKGRFLTPLPPVPYALPLAASSRVYMGSAVSKTSAGYGRQLTVADANFYGFALETGDNNVQGAANANGDKIVPLAGMGEVQLDVTGVTGLTDVGSAVYATDGDTFTLDSTNAIRVGTITRWVVGTTVRVYFEAAPFRSV